MILYAHLLAGIRTRTHADHMHSCTNILTYRNILVLTCDEHADILRLQEHYGSSTGALQESYRSSTYRSSTLHRSPTRALQELYTNSSGALQELRRSPTGALLEPFRSSTGALQERGCQNAVQNAAERKQNAALSSSVPAQTCGALSGSSWA
jgi:hypothetical protein